MRSCWNTDTVIVDKQTTHLGIYIQHRLSKHPLRQIDGGAVPIKENTNKDSCAVNILLNMCIDG